jgi:hypothetical protein
MNHVSEYVSFSHLPTFLLRKNWRTLNWKKASFIVACFHRHTHMCCWTADFEVRSTGRHIWHSHNKILIIRILKLNVALVFFGGQIYYRNIFMKNADFFLCFSCGNDFWWLLISIITCLNNVKYFLHDVFLDRHFNQTTDFNTLI